MADSAGRARCSLGPGRRTGAWGSTDAPPFADPRIEPRTAGEEDVSPTRLATGPWNRSATRGLVVLVAVAVACSGWWWWAARPRPAIAAPTVVATGVSLSGATGSARQDSSGPDPAASTIGSVAGEAPTVTGDRQRTVVVHVVGQVKSPGLVTLPVGSRVDDALAAAGGVTRSRAADSVNLARVLVDGEQVVVGFAAQAVAGVLGIAPVRSGGLVNLNSADAAAFEGLPGVGPVLAERIVQWRVTNGPFRSVDELGEVSGIGDSIMAQLRTLVSV
jgi:competence protein ComEA